MSVFDIVEDTTKTATAGPIPAVGADFAPGVAEQLASMAATDMPPIAAARSVPKIEFMDGKRVPLVVDLEYPIKIDGRPCRQIKVKRLSTKEVGALMDAFRAKRDGDPSPDLPIYTDTDGNMISQDVIDALDDNDGMRLEEAAASFLPQRLRILLGLNDEVPPTGVSIEPTSAVSAAGPSAS